MIFREELAKKILAGEKTVTRRHPTDNPRSPWWRGGCRYKAGSTYTINPGRGASRIGYLTITAVDLEPLATIVRPGEVQAEGFPDVLAFVETWAAMHGPFDPVLPVWRVEFAAVPLG